MTRPTAPQSPPRPSGSDGRLRAASEPSHPGTYFIGRYRVVDDIGVGGMATVHLGRMDGAGGFQKWVAIKRIHPHLVENEQVIKMFLDEARIAASISHPNVAQVFDLGSHEDTHWIAMEYLHGEPLREVLRHVMENGPLMEPPLAARIIADAAEGLHAAHELRGKDGRPLNLVHRDVTPHNLFITYDGVVKVVDFGIAKVTGRLSTTQAGTLKGKIAYMAPEQIRGKDIDRRTDIFALGVVLWELTTGRRLFRMDTDLETVERVQACVVPPPSSMSYDYPAELESIVMRALRKERAERYQTARDLSRALQQYLMRAGQFVGPEEISAYVRDLFGERIKQREAHLKWAADVTKTLSFEQIRPAMLAAGLSPAAARRDIEASASDDGDYEEEEDDDADETVVEPFRAALMRQEAVKHHSQKPPRPQPPNSGTPPPGSSSDSRERVRNLSGDGTDASTTRRVVSEGQVRPPSEPALASNDLLDADEDEEEIATVVREPAAMLVQDRLIMQRERAPSARLSTAEGAGSNVVEPKSPPAGVVPPPQAAVPVASSGPAVVPSPHQIVPAAPAISPAGVVPAPPGASPVPPPTGEAPAAVSVPGIAVPPGMPHPLMMTGSGPAVPGPSPAIPGGPPMGSGPYAQVPYQPGPINPMSPVRTVSVPGFEYPQNALRSGAYPTMDPYFDENQWARGLRGASPVLVYIAAAVGGFLIVAVLIAVLLGGPNRGQNPSPPPPAPTAT